MFPLLPAILLLLLQGPSNLERLSANGRLPGQMEAVVRCLSEPTTLREADALVLASILVGEDPRLSQALISILRADRKAPELPIVELAAAIKPSQEGPHLLSEGFARSHRSRDGPTWIA